jgi:hypothetical protein
MEKKKNFLLLVISENTDNYFEVFKDVKKIGDLDFKIDKLHLIK